MYANFQNSATMGRGTLITLRRCYPPQVLKMKQLCFLYTRENLKKETTLNSSIQEKRKSFVLCHVQPTFSCYVSVKRKILQADEHISISVAVSRNEYSLQFYERLETWPGYIHNTLAYDIKYLTRVCVRACAVHVIAGLYIIN